jgi:transcriptional regulator GlxA family with amidase domain
MAQAVGVSQKTLETAFKQVLGMTPARYLMLSRLNAAHRQLVDGQADELTVLKVALQWGFSHCSRFSAAYRQLFGELPSQTLRRSSGHA